MTSKLEKLTTEQLSVQIRNLNYYYGKGDLRTQILHNINLDLPLGQIIIMTGPSGSGKTTLLSLIGALRSNQEGSLKILGQELQGLSNSQLVEVRRNIGFIFQSHNLFDSLTASQNVEIAVELNDNWREKRKLAIQILSQLGLSHRVNYKPNALSGGQKQRVAIARALINQPQLILADEPTAALDDKSSYEVVKLMQKLVRDENRTILIVTHDNSIMDYADQTIKLVAGHLD
ncbi:MAG: ATP-binding cassette domain-containing protein [Calothrix sp. SM1_7_51]|nr:ATP-binding cassette domain-containing protein [Calothrix sp. SM1_7_51]